MKKYEGSTFQSKGAAHPFMHHKLKRNLFLWTVNLLYIMLPSFPHSPYDYFFVQYVFLFACKNLKISRHSLFLSNKSNVLESSMNNVTPEKGMLKKGKFLVIFQSLDLVFICQVMCCQLIKFLKVPSLFRIFFEPILSFL